MTNAAAYGTMRHMPHLTPVAVARAKAGLTQEQLAEKVGASIRTIKRLEAGESRPRLPLAWRLCQVLDLEFADLLDGAA